MLHKPVLLRETLDSLGLRSGLTVVDGTLGSGGHAREILEVIGAQGRLVALDQDPEAIKRCQKLFADHPNATLHQENFRNIDQVLQGLGISEIDAALLDLGFSSDQLEDPARGFSFGRPGPLDMRMNSQGPVTAADLLADLPEDDLARLFREFGEERWAGRIARKICETRNSRRIETTEDLAALVNSAIPGGSYKSEKPGWAKRHPATKVFQALRIAVNQELESVIEALPKFFQFLRPHGRLSVISFHSLEDRIVKHQFREWKQAKIGKVLTKKPVIASDEEIESNSRARSAKLRTVEKIPHEIHT